MTPPPIAGGRSPGNQRRAGRRRHRWVEAAAALTMYEGVWWVCERCGAERSHGDYDKRKRYVYRECLSEVRDPQWTTTAPECVPREGK